MTKQSAIAALLVLSTIACAVYEKKQPVEGDEAIVAAYVRAWNQHDSTAIDTLLAPGAVHEDVAQNFRSRSSRDVMNFMRDLIATQPDFKWTITNSYEDGRIVTLDWRWSSTYTGPDSSGKNVSGKRISGKGASIAEVENGRIRRFTNYYDRASFFR
jgi:steroid delta-isomerase-like uncharacterized protein